MTTSPHLRKADSVRTIMLKVMVALLPGIAAYVYFFGTAILIQLALASLVALSAEALMLQWRGKPVRSFITDGSVLLTGWLIALSFPPLSPWWLTTCGVLMAVVVAKHLYGGLGQNPFNPAMVGFAAMIVAFPALMSQWPTAGHSLDFATQWQLIFIGQPSLDAMTSATPLDALRTALRSVGMSAHVALNALPSKGLVAGDGWEWVAAGYLVGGLWLLQQRLISWHGPFAFIGTLFAFAGICYLINPGRFAPPLFHIFAGAAMLGAFFIITDPVSGATTPRGKLIFGCGVATITYILRVFGNYPDGVAFGVLLMNLCVPLIDMWTQPSVFGHRKSS